MTKRAFVTVVTRNYAHYARVALDSVRRYHPDADRYVCFADPPPENWLATIDWANVILGRDLAIPSWERYAFQYTPFELTCALKPHIVNKLLQCGYDEIIYVDGDMQLFGPLSDVTQALETSSIVLTPHLLRPLPIDGKRPDESAFLLSGTYNAGFFAVRADATTREFVDWWIAMVRKHSIIDMAASLFVDQKWLSLVPGLFDDVKLLRHAGYNVGHWSLSQFAFCQTEASQLSDSRVLVDGKPLILMHYSGMTPNKPHEYLTSQTRTHLDHIPALKHLVDEYHRSLAEAGTAQFTTWGCEFDTLRDGTPIHPAWREAIRRDHELFTDVSNPFDSASYPNLAERFATIEQKAYKWRRDWMIKWPKQKGIKGKIRSTNDKLKQLFQRLMPRKKSA